MGTPSIQTFTNICPLEQSDNLEPFSSCKVSFDNSRELGFEERGTAKFFLKEGMGGQPTAAATEALLTRC